MAYICYRATISSEGCSSCNHCRFDPERGEKACFAKEVTDEEQYYNYLEWLRRSGQTNMYGAAQYLFKEFPDITPDRAGEILGYWMAHYNELSEKYGWKEKNNE